MCGSRTPSHVRGTHEYWRANPEGFATKAP